MADQNIKDFTVNWVLFGLLFFALMAFTLTFVYENNQDALGTDQGTFENYRDNLEGSLVEIEEATDIQINNSAELQSSDATLGGRAAASTSYGFSDTGRNFWKESKGFIAWVFSGQIGLIIVAVFGSLIAIIAIFYIINLIRSLR